jgi:hypothetical protein
LCCWSSVCISQNKWCCVTIFSETYIYIITFKGPISLISKYNMMHRIFTFNASEFQAWPWCVCLLSTFLSRNAVQVQAKPSCFEATGGLAVSRITSDFSLNGYWL